ncbi:nickel pincer cofactor biosynthesis protein LarB [Desulfosporosinus sp.]|uniref:nickel pincer cofactor biosynthesis protein LarB n=1 Tax=Desulfosporosinus sp. TaxID=157907 RepID=UPI000E9D3323|nr:nickel pincer cofactor biosynthesis protein LarB [Desulfosporosinus sp.]MBC2722911.1 nickel pincer cofactor biosynthesis protein LarB [Desulfosporosinus sp.]MBC2725369.1 nickel pincer cofactor biosynthesis protein LarB [Desulfosporosinus sp.]HBV85701.1 nickel pincer cofactor biosynthesis protein LarB [Desulfosporosinus sp.]
MNEETIRALLESVQQGSCSPDKALQELKDLPYENLDFARLDHHRALRTGQSEVIFCQGKQPDHIISILKHLGTKAQNVLATRLDYPTAEVILPHFPEAYYDRQAHCLLLRPLAEPTIPGRILIMTAGTADLPVAQEAWLTARYMGHEVDTLFDVGVAGIHRLLGQRELMDQADVIIVVAGMEGALASVVGGLVEQPVIAVPTSVGYGAHFQGLAALLSMLNSCASGIGVVNIDNGFGAASLASAIVRRIIKDR